jgi:hypothetical protein
VDFVLLDLWLGGSEAEPGNTADFMALEARELDKGREMLKNLHERFPLIPIYLLSFAERGAFAHLDRNYVAHTFNRRAVLFNLNFHVQIPYV